MAIVKATYTKSARGAKASIRYIQHRKGRSESRVRRTLYGSDGFMGRHEAYRMIDEARKGSFFYRLVISPDPVREDRGKDLSLRDVTEKTMQTLENLTQEPILWAAVVHDDHTLNRHVHAIAVVQGRLERQDFVLLRKSATEACLKERGERDLERMEKTKEEEEQWEWSL